MGKKKKKDGGERGQKNRNISAEKNNLGIKAKNTSHNCEIQRKEDPRNYGDLKNKTSKQCLLPNTKLIFIL